MEIIIPQKKGSYNLKINGELNNFDLSISAKEVSNILIILRAVAMTSTDEDKSLCVELSHDLFLSEVHCKSVKLELGLCYIKLIDYSFYPSEECALAKIMEDRLKEDDEMTVTGLNTTISFLTEVGSSDFELGDSILVNS